ncbi:hypothetical protein RHABOEDO_000420 [Candidatus Rhabdochlamydia oedothoracis]|uniref:Uncharacterized protein n=1 Tax=Candidatus Rhabdochlamydia oedothoracis TaxID=2720720 RepID=A0ABX8UZD0_9BACT|nr:MULTISPECIES: hypothetical protein [Rhabdochlamydia]KAG6559493.1 hypothetical protein RHOW815_000468 [Candidatus Rhabdochlamydia sp. W815]MCL6756537.1 hypothetical protein [Candidatus Rhabdochlamydia oedothoracis]QYF48289.1 hypothetical protein RHABOEDO_000420 [Candidatus Rhabdochlamydia oedothoracis]
MPSINTDPSWLGLDALFLEVQASKCFLPQQKYHERALDVYDVGEELLSGVELLNDAKKLAVLISLSSDLQKRLEKVNEVFYLFTQVFYLFQERYQGYLHYALSCHPRKM